MASAPITFQNNPVRSFLGALSDRQGAISGPVFDATLFWGVSLLALLFVLVAIECALALPKVASDGAMLALIVGSAIFSDSHLIAVVPRAYLNRDVFSANRFRLTVVPLLLLALLLVSPTMLALAGAMAIL